MEPLQLEGWRVEAVIDIDDGHFAAADIYPEMTRDLLHAALPLLGEAAIDPSSLDLRLSFHAFLLRGHGLTILVDSCIGEGKERPARPSWHRRAGGGFLDGLGRLGVAPEDVDLVLCTHLHADHVGWNTRLEDGAWVPTFPNARYLMAEPEYRHWKDVHDRDPAAGILYGSFADSVLPVVARGQAEMVRPDHDIAPALAMEPAFGHTPGTVLIHAGGAGGHGVFCGDVLHHPLQLLRPEMSTRFCWDPARSRESRTRLLRAIADTATWLLPAHFRQPRACRVTTADGSYRLAIGEGP